MVVVLRRGQVDELQKDLKFVSASTDGYLYQWTLSRSELQRETLLKLRPSGKPLMQPATPAAVEEDLADTPMAKVPASATCVDFNKVRRGVVDAGSLKKRKERHTGASPILN